jgi:hypothetical protein
VTANKCIHKLCPHICIQRKPTHETLNQMPFNMCAFNKIHNSNNGVQRCLLSNPTDFSYYRTAVQWKGLLLCILDVTGLEIDFTQVFQ